MGKDPSGKNPVGELDEGDEYMVFFLYTVQDATWATMDLMAVVDPDKQVDWYNEYDSQDILDGFVYKDRPANIVPHVTLADSDGNVIHPEDSNLVVPLDTRVRVSLETEYNDAAMWAVPGETTVMTEIYARYHDETDPVLIGVFDTPIADLTQDNIVTVEYPFTIDDDTQHDVTISVVSDAFNTVYEHNAADNNHVEKAYDIGQANLSISLFVEDRNGDVLDTANTLPLATNLDLRACATSHTDDARLWSEEGEMVEIVYFVQFLSPYMNFPPMALGTKEIPVARLQEDEMICETLSFMPPPAGINGVTVFAEVDTESVVAEADEVDNASQQPTFAIEMYNRPDLTATVRVEDEAGEEITSVPDNTLVYPVCVVENVGTFGSVSDIDVIYTVDSIEVGRGTVEAWELDPSSMVEKRMSQGTLLSRGIHTVGCQVDVNLVVPELFENNNADTVNITSNASRPYLRIYDVYLTYRGYIVNENEHGDRQEVYHPHAMVKNYGASMQCKGYIEYFINADRFRDHDLFDSIGTGQIAHEEVLNDDIYLGQGGNRSYRVVVSSTCGEFPTFEYTMYFVLD